MKREREREIKIEREIRDIKRERERLKVQKHGRGLNLGPARTNIIVRLNQRREGGIRTKC